MNLLIIVVVVALAAWAVITMLSFSAAGDERSEIRSDATNVLLSSMGYIVILFACLHFDVSAVSWIAFILLGVLALIPLAGAVAILAKKMGSWKRILSAFLAAAVPVFIDVEILLNCILK